MPKRWRAILCLLLASCCGAAAWFAFVTEANVPRETLLLLHPDHLRHVAALAAISALACLLWAPYGFVVSVLLAAGGAVELVQWPLGRQATPVDFVASGAGVLLGMMVAIVLRRASVGKRALSGSH